MPWRIFNILGEWSLKNFDKQKQTKMGFTFPFWSVFTIIQYSILLWK